MWIQAGGVLGIFNISKEFEEKERKKMYLKYSALEYDYDWIIILEPNGILMKPLDELFNLYNRTITRVKFTKIAIRLIIIVTKYFICII